MQKSNVSRGSTIGGKKPPAEISKDMRDTPYQAQARSFFRCQFGHEKKEVEEKTEEQKQKEKKKLKGKKDRNKGRMKEEGKLKKKKE